MTPENRKRFHFTAWIIALLLGAGAATLRADVRPVPADPAVEARINALLEAMTLDQKVGQLTQISGGKAAEYNPGAVDARTSDLLQQIRAGKVGSFLNALGAEYTNELQRAAVEESPHKIPLILGYDVIHGYRTIFPIPLAEAASWDPALAERSARIAAVEASAEGLHWTFAPMVDIARDARWGRIAEGAGEDPYLGAAFAVARVRGFQGDDLAAKDTLVACAKHFVAYGAAEAGRDYNTVDISLQTLHNVHLPPFRAAVRAGVGTLMSSFNEINGIPGTAYPYTLTEILRRQWAFTGFVVSDWDSVGELVEHGFAANDTDAAVKAIQAGVDMDMSTLAYRDHLPEAVQAGRVDMATVDQAVRRVLRIKHRLGLFEDPYTDPGRAPKVLLCDEHRAAAREIARASMVLLKNDNDTLPIKPQVKSIAVIGPLADSAQDPLGTWAGQGKANDVVTALTGIRARAGDDVKITHALGCAVQGGDTSEIAPAVEVARGADFVILIVGESRDLSGEAHSRTDLSLPGHQLALVKAVLSVGKPTAVVLMNGRPMCIPYTAEHAPAILVAWHAGIEYGHALADLLFGDHSPSGKLPACFPRNVGQLPLYYAAKSTGRPLEEHDPYTTRYIDSPNSPQFPFGFGLTYTTFEYANLKLSSTAMKPNGRIQVRVDVKNTGDRAAAEVVQLYVRDLVGSLTRPVKELEGFRKVNIAPGETETVEFELAARDLGFFGQNLEYVIEPGQFKLWIGPNSAEGIEADFEITE